MNSSQRWHTRQLFKSWLIAVGLMSIGWTFDSYGLIPQLRWIAPGLEEMSAADAFFFGLKASALELGALYVILRPWTFTTRTRYRSLLALILFLPYFAFLLLIGPRGEFSNLVHLFWVMAVVLALATGTIKPIEDAVGASAEYEPKRLL